MKPGIYHLGPDPGMRPDSNLYQMGPTLIVGGSSNYPFPPYTPGPTPIRVYSPQVSTRIGPIRGIDYGRGSSRGQFRPGLTIDAQAGMRASQAAIDRSRAATKALEEASRKSAAKAHKQAIEHFDNFRKSADKSREAAKKALDHARDQRIRDEAARVRHRQSFTGTGWRPAVDQWSRPPQSQPLTDRFGRRPPAESRPRIDLVTLGPRWGGPDGVPSTPPPSRGTAPLRVVLPQKITQEMQDLWGTMIKEGRKYSYNPELNALLTVDLDGKWELRNKQFGGAFASGTDRTLPFFSDLKILGSVHTHPKASDAGFSGGDVAKMVNDGDPLKILVVEGKLFLLMRTGQTSKPGLNQIALQDVQSRRMAALMKEGKSEKSALHITNVEMATQYGLAYYEGQGGTLSRINQ
jgi:hypothetical protein